jgi:hypothetical protein
MYMHTDWQHNHGATPLFFFLLPLANSSLFPLPFPFTYLETLLGVIGSRPPWSQVARKLISPFPSLPHSLPIPPLFRIPDPLGFPELNMRLTKTTSWIWLAWSGTVMLFSFKSTIRLLTVTNVLSLCCCNYTRLSLLYRFIVRSELSSL